MHLIKNKAFFILVLCTFILLCIVLCVWLNCGGMAFAASIDIADIPNINITLKYHGHCFVYNSNQHIPNITNFVQERTFQKNNRAGSHAQRANIIDKMIASKLPINDAFCYMFFGWKEYYQSVKKAVDVLPKDATLKFIPNNYPYFDVKEERIGFKLDEEEVLKDILKQLHSTDTIEIELNPQKLFPRVYYADLIKQTSKLSAFVTSYQSSSVYRKNNIKLALKNFNGMCVKPHESISFNATTGPRTLKGGYKEAHMILDSEYVDAVGGGVCQASTTLYNALLLAGVQIDEVHAHSLPSSYVQLGFDAMVNFGTSDLRFTNPYDTPIYIRVDSNEKNVKVEIYGQNYSQNITIRQKNEILSILPPPNDKIVVDDSGEYLNFVQYKDEWFYKKQPKNGYKVNAYLEYYKNGKLLGRKLIRSVTYKPQQGIKVFGAKNRQSENDVNDKFLQTLSNILGKY
ncbi:MAG: VanW family protein [Clostridia bacterium]|nr:VanW family protein [Clostridia bacterium]